jgi:hypothetical protein
LSGTSFSEASVKKLYVAVLFAFSALFAGSLAYAAPAAPNHTVLNVKLKEGVNVVTAGKTTYDITVKNNQVVNIAPVIPGGAMGGQHMSTKSVKFTSTGVTGASGATATRYAYDEPRVSEAAMPATIRARCSSVS